MAASPALEKVVMALRTRGDYFGLQPGIDTTQIVSASKMVSQITGPGARLVPVVILAPRFP